jgi:thiamine-phosphate pyrophosphorylase
MPSLNFRILLVTDRHQIGDRSLPAVLEEAFSGGITAVHLRERDLSTRDLTTLARDIQIRSRRHRAQLIVNDRIDLALALDLDGVHLRADSLPTAVARQLLGPHRLIGVSTHSLADVQHANEAGADYVVFGPIFATPSKQAFGPPLGLDALAAACAASHVPVLAIGGVTRERIEPVRRSGAAGVAVIGALLSRDDVSVAARELCGAMNQ